MKRSTNPFAYPFVIKQVQEFITVSVPDLEITVAETAPSGCLPGSAGYVTVLNALILKAARKVLERTRLIEELPKNAPRPARAPSLIRNSITTTKETKEELSTKEAAAFLGVSQASLKRWESRGLVAASKTAGGHRKFNLGILNEAKASMKVGFRLQSPSDHAMTHMRKNLAKAKVQP